MLFALLVFLAAFALEAIGTVTSVIGLSNLFAGSIVVIVLAVCLDFAKLVTVSFTYKYFKHINWLMKTYMVTATVVLMTITSVGAFGYLSAAFQQSIAGTNQDNIVLNALTDEQSRLQKRKEEIDAQIAKLPDNVIAGRRALMKQFGPEVTRLNDRLAEIDKKLPELKVAAVKKNVEVGPIIYVAQAFNTDPEHAVKWVIMIIIFVFDPLAIALLLAGNFLLARRKDEKLQALKDEAELSHAQHERIRQEALEAALDKDTAEIDAGARIEQDALRNADLGTLMVNTCTRPQPHDGPCNGLPCEYALKTYFAETDPEQIDDELNKMLEGNIPEEDLVIPLESLEVTTPEEQVADLAAHPAHVSTSLDDVQDAEIVYDNSQFNRSASLSLYQEEPEPVEAEEPAQATITEQLEVEELAPEGYFEALAEELKTWPILPEPTIEAPAFNDVIDPTAPLELTTSEAQPVEELREVIKLNQLTGGPKPPRSSLEDFPASADVEFDSDVNFKNVQNLERYRD